MCDSGIPHSGSDGPCILAVIAVGSAFYCVNGSYAYVSTDAGISWNAETAGFPANPGATEIAAADGTLYVGTSSKGVFVCDGDAAAWTAANNGLPAGYHVRSLAARGSTVYVTGVEFGVYVSTNRGAVWRKMSEGVTSSSLYAVSVESDRVLLADGNQVRIAPIPGSPWKRLAGGLDHVFRVYDVLCRDGRVFAGTYGGVYRLDSGAASFRVRSSGIHSGVVQSFADLGPSLYAASNGSGIFRSIDGGLHWSLVADTLADLYYCTIAAHDNLLMATTAGGGVFVSSDAGSTWTPRNAGLHDLRVHPLISASDVVYAPTYNGLNASTDHGVSWSDLNGGVLAGKNIRAFAVDGATLYAGVEDVGVYRSTDNGGSWELRLSRLPNLMACNAMLFDGQTQFAAMWTDGLFRSTDGGGRWDLCLVGPPWPRQAIALLQLGGYVFVGGDSGVFVSQDRGAHWRHFSGGLPRNHRIMSLKAVYVDPDWYLLAGVEYRSLWRRKLSDVTGADPEPAAAGFALEQNYPNPFSPSTSVAFTLPAQCHARVTVVNVLGAEVAVLADAVTAAGRHTLRFDAGRLPSGVYVCTLQAGATRLQRTMVLVGR
jgi:photosystem II stability/assembly factor-like uncharacterized protein